VPGPLPPFRVFLDFDGTLVEPNVAIELVGEFVPDGDAVARELDELLHAGTITLRQAWERQAALLPLDRVPEMIRWVVDRVPLRSGAHPLLGLLRRRRVPVTILSGGLDFYIGPVLRREGIDLPVLSDSMERAPDGHLRVTHPFGHPTCRLCGICKAQIVTSPAPDGVLTIFIGDGSTDRYAAEVADLVFARRRLLQYCREAGIPCFAFENFQPVYDKFAAWLDGVEPIPPSGRRPIQSTACPISQTLGSSLLAEPGQLSTRSAIVRP
jgi:2,3-diketo-5-methylthio-1-phosphopentane phosphatase